MSETLLKLFLSDLKRVRIVCSTCKTAVEVTVQGLATVRDLPCPSCPPGPNGVKPMLRGTGSGDVFSRLASVILDLQCSKGVEVEFVVTTNGEK